MRLYGSEYNDIGFNSYARPISISLVYAFTNNDHNRLLLFSEWDSKKTNIYIYIKITIIDLYYDTLPVGLYRL